MLVRDGRLGCISTRDVCLREVYTYKRFMPMTGTYKTEVNASFKLSGVYIGPLIRHCLIGKRGPRVQALRVPI